MTESDGLPPQKVPDADEDDVLDPMRNGPLRRFLLTVAYDGYRFRGWQKQPAPLRTVQGEMETVLRERFGNPKLRLPGASRTDAGVHAIGQRAFFETCTSLALEEMADVINPHLPDDILIVDVDTAPLTFDLLNGVDLKQYRYRIANTPVRPLFNRHQVHHVSPPLDVARMADAAQRLVGTHNFSSFAAKGHGRKNTVRTVFDCWIETDAGRAPHPGDPGEPTDAPAGPTSEHPQPGEVHVVIRGDGFLYKMVRIVAGTLVEIGRGSVAPEHIDTVLRPDYTTQAGPILPPRGLCLEWIRYRPGGLSKWLV